MSDAIVSPRFSATRPARRNAPPEILTPPTVSPPALPLGFPRNLAKMVSNYLDVIPEQAYHEPLVIAPGPPRMAFLACEEVLKPVLLDHWEDFPMGRVKKQVFKPLFGRSLGNSDPHDWRWQRGAVSPLFRNSVLRQHGPQILSAADAMIARWRAGSPGDMRNIEADMISMVARLVTDTLLGNGADEFAGLLEKGRDTYYRGMNWWIIYTMLRLPHWLPRPHGQAMRAEERAIRGGVARLVRARLEAGSPVAGMVEKWRDARDPATGEGMPESRIVDNATSFIMAGFETVALTLTWTLFLLARSPVWEQNVLEEIERVTQGGPLGVEHLDQLTVVEQVINESMRLYPAAPVIIRDARRCLDYKGQSIGPGTHCVIPIYAIHRHRAYWEHPDSFDPSRFGPDRGASISKYHFMPFGAGPKSCIGGSLSMIELTLLLASLVRAASFSVDAEFDPRPTGRLFLRPARGMPLSVSMRDQ
ncbi:MAG: cytochrome P450 [Pseudomonadota bacterium]|nr:cytochrome P450 [Pseudomonadota bacterium]